MIATKSLHYQRIAQAIKFIRDHHKQQPALEDIAEHVQLSPTHFHRLFSEWAGTSPKKFLQYLTVHHARQLLQERPQTTLFDAAHETGLSGTSRLHDLFVTLEGMTPAEYKQGARNLTIRYQFAPTLFGTVLIASTDKGLCHLSFEEDLSTDSLRKQFPNAAFIEEACTLHGKALQIFKGKELSDIKLHLKGTPFQLKVWESLLTIPEGRLSTYGKLAEQTGKPGASRAVGKAIGSNPIAYLIPCHRVVQATGAVGGYRWGCTRKAAIIGWESVRMYS